ncbi:DUF4625 domain-containing protein [Labilibaculum euxinus]|uniref:DUF4625 domain-containing protein n=1 Tax=Labilibaculum euxinus TaxID=2686357 RepID=A0A7M4D4Z3_9BACT|nr:DUF4625 domain-containing protein [Labilibaculum euxinus]MUP37722.1 DUF4625 domain-containing protein [Labilibaculum euxinus]MVB06927.1 DUF4625 domain-containing protein [Labilibaculum euxinus]
MKFLKYALIVLFSIGMMSCGSSGGDDTDKEAPGITITAPTAGQQFGGEAIVKVSFTATDNVALKSYVVNVKLTKAASVASVKVTPEVFVFDKSGSLSGKTKDITFDMELPGNPEKGEYTVEIKVTDASTEENVQIANRIFVVN